MEADVRNGRQEPAGGLEPRSEVFDTENGRHG
jgi:hypothetical protein